MHSGGFGMRGGMQVLGGILRGAVVEGRGGKNEAPPVDRTSGLEQQPTAARLEELGAGRMNTTNTYGGKVGQKRSALTAVQLESSEEEELGGVGKGDRMLEGGARG